MTDSSTPHIRLHPMLQAALGTLDMTVESEMALFRQSQTLATLPNSDTAEETGDTHFLPQAAASAIADPATAEMLASDSPLNLKNSDAEQLIPPLDSTDDIVEDLTPAELALFQVDTTPETIQEPCADNLERQEAVLEPSPSAPLDQGDSAGAPLPPKAEEEDLHSSNLDPAIEDYLDSSTALRQHLEDSSTEPDPPPEFRKFTFNGLALLLGLGLLGTLAVILVLSASSLRKKLWPPTPQPEQTQSSVSPTEQGMPAPSPTASSSDTPTDIVATDGPDLSKKEFSDVSLDNLSRLQPSPSSAPSTAPVSGRPTPILPTAPPESVPILKDQKSQTEMFYVVLPYNNPVSLRQAQELVPTAFLINSAGKQQIQMGALENLAAAQQLGKQLRAQGLSAAIMSPN